MEKTGRELLREHLKKKGEADTVEDMLRIGFHLPPLLSVHHLHMHIIYPISDVRMKIHIQKILRNKKCIF